MNDTTLRAKLLFGIALLASAGFGLVTAQVRRGKTSRLDRSAQRKWHSWQGDAVNAAALSTAPLGKWYAHVPAVLLTSHRLWKRNRTVGALTLIGASLGAAGLSRILDRALAQRSPPPERGEPWQQSYPSGHALETSAVALTSSYVLQRERLVSAGPLSLLGLASAAAGAGRLIRDRHWTSDVVYELAR
jgi:membrane-associated phospholipid phosphatase